MDVRRIPSKRARKWPHAPGKNGLGVQRQWMWKVPKHVNGSTLI